MAQTLLSGHGFVSESCYACGVPFCITTEMYHQRLRDKKSFYCPNGHSQAYIGQTEVEKERDALRAQLQREQSARESAERSRKWAEKQARGANVAAGMAKAKVRRVMERVHAGVCPHCNRTFKQLAAHMKSKHAEQLAAK
jgi:uncharacterized Zn finger protein (UPF0148 family)